MRVACLDGNRKNGPFAFLAFHPDSSAVRADQLLYQSQTDPRSLVSARIRSLNPMKTIKHTRQLRLGDADTGVSHRQLGVVTAPLRSRNILWFSRKQVFPTSARSNASPMTGHAEAQHSLKSWPIA
jgi:hypothetical protein